MLEHQLRRPGIELRLSFRATLPTIRGNSGKLQQVFLNLFLNARDAMAEGGRLTVRTWAEAGSRTSKWPTPATASRRSTCARIYDPFFTTKGMRKGTGLGLSVTYGIVQEHNGIIEVESRPGAGTRFRLEFPASKKDQTLHPVREVATA